MNIKLGQLLLSSGIITSKQLEKALEKQNQEGNKLGFHLVDIQAITEDDLNKFLARQQSVESVNIDSLEIDEKTVHLITGEIARRYEVLPIKREGRRLIVAMTDPNNLFAIDDLRFSLGMDIEPRVCASSMIKRALTKYYPDSEALVTLEESQKQNAAGSHSSSADADEEDIIENDEMLVGDEVFESMIVQEDDEAALEEEDLNFEVADSPVVKLVNSLIADAVRRGASDIHFEPFEKYVRVRFRIDGVLHEVMRPSRKYRSAMVSRLKILGGMDIADHHLPQDGRQKILVGDRFVDLRLATLPTLFGEKVEVRLLDRSAVILDLQKLGFEEESLKVFRKGIKRPFGIVLVTGPTGCGKTTTLYSALTELNDIGVNIMTAENPVEFNLKGINQVQMNDDVGLTFANALRAYLRQDPDIIMVGEIRDKETSEIAIRAALTGHLVLSTTHTNDAPSTINRLIDIGTEPFMLSTSLVCIASQRLIRKICTKCKTAVSIPDEAFVDAGIDPARFRGVELFTGTGCSHCNNTGYKGRMGIFEVMAIDDDIRQLIEGDANSIEIEKMALAKGMVNLREAALRKLEAGLTTFDEVLRETIANE
ncbi:MAG: Flp pilus assembly complex ATPase component TadA [Candidatus Fermentibacteraceae bacterium]|nr:Flp pilus assembly complex ATPase component TadA [Candidatus Fermentibacteraceae bacterium]